VPSAQDATLRNDGTGGYLGVNYKGLSLMSSYTEFETASFEFGTVGDVRWKRGFGDLGYSLKATGQGGHWRGEAAALALTLCPDLFTPAPPPRVCG
jgi:hypothetical protein